MLFTENEKLIIRKLLKYDFHYIYGRCFLNERIFEKEDDGVYFYYEDSLDDKYYMFLRKTLADEETNKMFFNKIEAINLISKLIELKYITAAKVKNNYHYYLLWGHHVNSLGDNLKEDQKKIEFGHDHEYIDRTNYTIHLTDCDKVGFKLSFINRNMIDFMDGFVYIHPELKDLVDNDFKTSEEIFREKELVNAKKSLRKATWSILVAAASFIISALTLCATLFGCNGCWEKTSPEKTKAYTYIMPENNFDSETSQALN